MNFINFSCLHFRVQNVLIPPNRILLDFTHNQAIPFIITYFITFEFVILSDSTFNLNNLKFFRG